MTESNDNHVTVGDLLSDPKAEASARQTNKRTHGKGFVYFGLAEADEAVRKIDHHAKRMSKEGFARALGHATVPGRFTQKLEALKTFKLLDEDGDDVVLTPLATDMLYGMSEASRIKARATAFLAYDAFSKTFVECPKNQEHPVEYLLDYVRAKLGIVNDVDRFKRLFLASAHFAGLLEGELNLNATSIRLRNASVPAVNSELPPDAGPGRRSSDVRYDLMGSAQAVDALEALGLSRYGDRAEVALRSAGKVKLNFEDGTVTFEVNRPQRITIKHVDLLTDLPEMVTQLRSKGFDV